MSAFSFSSLTISVQVREIKMVAALPPVAAWKACSSCSACISASFAWSGNPQLRYSSTCSRACFTLSANFSRSVLAFGVVEV